MIHPGPQEKSYGWESETAVHPHPPPIPPLRNDTVHHTERRTWSNNPWSRRHVRIAKATPRFLRRIAEKEPAIICRSSALTLELGRRIGAQNGNRGIITSHSRKHEGRLVIRVPLTSVMTDGGTLRTVVAGALSRHSCDCVSYCIRPGFAIVPCCFINWFTASLIASPLTRVSETVGYNLCDGSWCWPVWVAQFVSGPHLGKFGGGLSLPSSLPACHEFWETVTGVNFQVRLWDGLCKAKRLWRY